MLKQLLLPACLAAMTPVATAQDGATGIPEGDGEQAGQPEQAARPVRILSSVTSGDLLLLLPALDAKAIAAGQNATGAPFIFAETEGGMTFGIYTLCAEDGGQECRGIEFMAVLGTFASDEQVNALNRDYAAVSVYKAEENTVHISRYVILDHGVTWENLIENGRVFQLLCDKVVARLAPSPPGQPE